MKKMILLIALFGCALLVQGALPPAETLRAAAEKTTVRQYPDANSVLLYDREAVRVKPSGGSLRHDSMAIKVLTEKGRRENRFFRFYFSDQFETVTIRRCAVLRGRQEIPVDVAQNSRVSVESSQMDSNIYDPHQKTLTLTIPDLRIGDTVLLEVEEHTFKPRMKGIYCGFFGLQADQPIRHYEVEITTPKGMELKSIAIKNEVVPVKHSRKAGKDGTTYFWSVDRVPQVIPEPKMPPVYLCAQRLLVSTAKDYAEVSRWYDALCRPRLAEVSPEMKKTVAELTENAKTPREKADALFQFVSQKIRYMGITEEKEAPGYEPHPVKLTFEKRYGVCRDKAALLVALLRMAGLEAYPVLFSMGYPKDAEVPNNYFNHAIAAVKLDGKIHLLDPTYENTHEWLPAFECEMSYLIASPAGAGLARSPASAPEQNGLRIATCAALSDAGKLTGTSEILFLGADDQIYRGAFVREKKEFQREFFAQVLQKNLPGAVLDELKLEPAELRDMSKPFRAELKFHGDFRGTGELRNLPLVLWGNRIGITVMQLRNCSLQKRAYPMELAVPSCVREKLTLTLPEHFRCVAPRHCKYAGTVLSAQCAISESKGKVSICRDLSLNRKRVQPTEYPELKRNLAELDRFDRGGLLLKHTQNTAADVEIFLRHDTTFELLSESSAVVTSEVEKKILTYAGIKGGSELHLSFNPAQEELTLLKGEVIDPDGKVHPLSPAEQNRMDAPGADAAPAYSPNQILAVSFPGVKPGSVLRYTVKRVLKNRPGIAYMRCFAGGSPIRFMSLKVIDHTGKLVQKVIAPEGTIRTVKGPAGTTLYSRQNIPAVKAEMNAPETVRFAPAVLLGNTTPKSFAEKLNAALEKQTRGQPKAAARAEELVKGMKDNAEKTRAIRDFVARSIRSAGPALSELPYTAFSPADVTLARGCGNSADRAILLAAMLRAAGLPAEFLALTDLPLPEGRAALLSPLLFDRVFVRSGQYVLNGSSQYAPLSIRPFAPGGVMLTLPAGQLLRAYPDAMVHRTFQIRVEDSGAAELCCTLEYTGKKAEAMNRRWSEMTPAKKAQYAESLLTALSHTAVMVRPPERDGKNAQEKFRLRYTAKVPDFCTLDGGTVSFELPGARAFSALLPGGAEERTTPIDWRFGAGVRDDWEIVLPEKWQFLRLPEDHAAALAGMVFQMRTGRKNNTVKIQAAALPLRNGAGLPPDAMLVPQTAPLLDQWKKTFEMPEQRIVLAKTDKEK